MLSRIVSVFCICCISVQMLAQPLAAYTDIQNKVMVWDNGMIRKIDYLPPVEMHVGRNVIGYLDNSRSFKIYYKGGMRTMNLGFTNEIRVSDDLLAFRNASSLNVFDNGKTTNLTRLVGDFYLGDSMLLFYDGLRRDYKVYYDGDIYPIENFLAGEALVAAGNNSIKVSDNIAAYVNYANQFRIFYRGETISQEDNLINGFDVGRNTVAYVDINRQFKIFHNGMTFLTEDFPPLSYAVGDDLVAYVSSDGYFKIFYEDSVHTIGFMTPDYTVSDRLIVFKDNTGYFKVFYKGVFTTLESFVPQNYMAQYNSVAYVNAAGTLRLFSKGQLYDVTNAAVDSWSLNYDVVQYQIGRGIFRVFYEGTEY